MVDVFKYDSGTLRYYDDVIEKIAYTAACGVEGAVCIKENSKELMQKIGAKTIKKDIKVNFEEENINIFVCINVEPDVNVLNTAVKVQNSVKKTVEMMTGFSVKKVDVHVAKIERRSA